MPLVKKGEELWFFEELYSDVAYGFLVEEILFQEQSQDDNGKLLHNLMILKTPRFGKVLTLDEVVQTTEADEYFYHEPLVHCAALSCFPLPKSALLVGCDGGTLRETVKHLSLELIDVVDIARTVIDVVEKYMPA